MSCQEKSPPDRPRELLQRANGTSPGPVVEHRSPRGRRRGSCPCVGAVVCSSNVRAAERKAVQAELPDNRSATLLKGPSWAIAWVGTPRGHSLHRSAGTLSVATDTVAAEHQLHGSSIVRRTPLLSREAPSEARPRQLQRSCWTAPVFRGSPRLEGLRSDLCGEGYATLSRIFASPCGSVIITSCPVFMSWNVHVGLFRMTLANWSNAPVGGLEQ